MQITIHRGINQLGGCITEISTATTRIFIDMGSNLPGVGTPMSKEEEQAFVQTLFAQNKRLHEAVFYTHGHGDHVGMMLHVPTSVSQYMSQCTKDILMIKQQAILDKLNKFPSMNDNDWQEAQCMKDAIESTITWQHPQPHKAPKPILFGDICVKPFFCSHSIYDAHMLLIEAEGKTILHTGDYRGHGYLSKGLIPTLKQYVGQVDYLITEGSNLSKPECVCITEKEVSKRMTETMRKHKYVFALTSSTDYERLISIGKAAREASKKVLTCSSLFHKMMQYFRHIGPSYAFNHTEWYDNTKDQNDFIETNKQLIDNGFVMLMGSGNLPNVRPWLQHLPKEEMILIYSTWDGYYKEEEQVLLNGNYKEIRDAFPNVVDIHTPGHADCATIQKVIETVSPKEGIIGIHKDPGTSLTTLNLPTSLLSKIIPENSQPDCVTIK